MLFKNLNVFSSYRLPLLNRTLSSLSKKPTYSVAKVASAVQLILNPLSASKKDVMDALSYLQQPNVHKHLNSAEQDLSKLIYSSLVKSVIISNLPKGLSEAQIRAEVDQRFDAFMTQNSPRGENRHQRFIYKFLVELICFLNH